MLSARVPARLSCRLDNGGGGSTSSSSTSSSDGVALLLLGGNGVAGGRARAGSLDAAVLDFGLLLSRLEDLRKMNEGWGACQEGRDIHNM
jgi:hypothetical protein